MGPGLLFLAQQQKKHLAQQKIPATYLCLPTYCWGDSEKAHWTLRSLPTQLRHYVCCHTELLLSHIPCLLILCDTISTPYGSPHGSKAMALCHGCHKCNVLHPIVASSLQPCLHAETPLTSYLLNMYIQYMLLHVACRHVPHTTHAQTTLSATMLKAFRSVVV